MQSATIFVKQTIKKIHLRTGHESPEGKKRNSSILSFTLALDGWGEGVFTAKSRPLYPTDHQSGSDEDWKSGNITEVF
jgi:hypothetical protein